MKRYYSILLVLLLLLSCLALPMSASAEVVDDSNEYNTNDSDNEFTADPTESTVLAEFVYAESALTVVDGSDLVTPYAKADDGDDSYLYLATGGVFQSGSLLTASTNGINYKHLSWAFTEIEDTTVLEFAASEKNNWTADAGLTITTSTKGYDNVRLSIDLAASKKGARNYQAYVISDGEKTPVGSVLSLSTNKSIQTLEVDLSDYSDLDTLTIFIGFADTININGVDLTLPENAASGSTFFNNIVLTSGAADSTVPEEPVGPGAPVEPTEYGDILAGFGYVAPEGALHKDELTEYADADNDYIYLATSGVFADDAALTGTVNGQDLKHVEWNSDLGASLVPSLRATSKNLWGAGAGLSVTTATTGYETVYFVFTIAASAKAPCNYQVIATFGESSQVVDTFTLAESKVLETHAVAMTDFEDLESVTFSVRISDTLNFSDADAAGTDSGSIYFNGVYVCGTKIVDMSSTTTYTFRFVDGSETTVAVAEGEELVKPENTQGYVWAASADNPLVYEEVEDGETPPDTTTYTFRFVDGSETTVAVAEGEELVKPENTQGYIWAVSEDSDLVFVEKAEFLLGDMNLDGTLSVTDVVLLRKDILNSQFDPVGDMSKDGALSVTDVVLLRKAILANKQ